jgi:K+-transporting ATPase ATPase B chain
VIVCVTLKPFADYANAPITIAAFISFVCLIPTTIAVCYQRLECRMDRALRANVITKSGKAVETAEIDVLLLDKTGTITIGKKSDSFYPAKESRRRFYQICSFEFAETDTPEGKSIVELGRN